MRQQGEISQECERPLLQQAIAKEVESSDGEGACGTVARGLGRRTRRRDDE